MLVVTHQVLEMFNEALHQPGPGSDADCFRLTNNTEGLGMMLEPPAWDDATYQYAGETVFAVPVDLQVMVAHLTLDLDNKGRFVLK